MTGDFKRKGCTEYKIRTAALGRETNEHSTARAGTQRPATFDVPLLMYHFFSLAHSLGCRVPDRRHKEEELALLQGACGSARSGDLVAIIGKHLTR